MLFTENAANSSLGAAFAQELVKNQNVTLGVATPSQSKPWPIIN
jgi:hypothetical protein